MRSRSAVTSASVARRCRRNRGGSTVVTLAATNGVDPTDLAVGRHDRSSCAERTARSVDSYASSVAVWESNAATTGRSPGLRTVAAITRYRFYRGHDRWRRHSVIVRIPFLIDSSFASTGVRTRTVERRRPRSPSFRRDPSRYRSSARARSHRRGRTDARASLENESAATEAPGSRVEERFSTAFETGEQYGTAEMVARRCKYRLTVTLTYS